MPKCARCDGELHLYSGNIYLCKNLKCDFGLRMLHSRVAVPGPSGPVRKVGFDDFRGRALIQTYLCSPPASSDREYYECETRENGSIHWFRFSASPL